MAGYLFYTGPGGGHLYPLVPTMLELRRRGHRVSVRTEAAQVCADLGLRAAPVDPRIPACEDDSWQATDPLDALRRSIRTSLDRARYEVADVQRAVAAERPDVLVVDNNCWGAAAAAEASGLPWAQAALFLLPLVSREQPAFGVGDGAADRAGAEQAAAARAAWLAAGRAINELLPPLNELRGTLGVPPLDRVWDTYLRAPTVLSYTGEPLERPAGDLPANVRLVGPGVWDPPADPPAWLDTVERPLVLVSVSTVFQNEARLVRTALDALAGEPFDVVVTTASLDPAQFAAPANVRLHRFVPHRAVLPRAAAVVCHGGFGIVQKALLHGVPVCAVPWGRDQFEVARRLVDCGAGTRVAPAELTPQRLRAAVREAVACRDAARWAGARLRCAGGPVAAGHVLSDLAPAALAA